MKNDVSKMVKQVTFFNVIVGLILTLLVYIVSSSYLFPVILGLIVAIINFAINGVVTNYSLEKATNYAKLYMFLSMILRIVLIAVIGIIIFRNNKFGIVAYMLGYSAHFVGIILYSMGTKKA